MVIKSRFQDSPPNCSIQQWLFGSSAGPLPDQKAYIDPEAPDSQFLTYAQLRSLSKRIAAGLLKHGLVQGGRVLLSSANHLNYPAVVMGIWMAGGVFTGANSNYTSRELAHQLQDSEASILIADSNRLEVALEAAERAGLPKNRIFAFDGNLAVSKTPGYGPLGREHWSKLIAEEEEGEKFEWAEPEDPKQTLCSINYSSGTVSSGQFWKHYSMNNI